MRLRVGAVLLSTREPRLSDGAVSLPVRPARPSVGETRRSVGEAHGKDGEMHLRVGAVLLST